jgi:hypothetical protein
MPKLSPEAAREEYIGTLPPSEGVKVLSHAEKAGPFPSDPDWLVALATHRATDAIRLESLRMEKMVTRMEDAAARVEAVTKEKGDLDLRSTGRSASVPLVRRGGTMGICAMALATYALIVYGTVALASRHIEEVVLYVLGVALGFVFAAFVQWVEPYIDRTPRRRR